ncbi:NAD(P)-binding protein, partial [Aureobasidium melanogenum]
MPRRVALLGATGQTGQAVLKDLLDREISINIYVRSASKLIQKFPSLSSMPNTQIFSGEISDSTLIKNLLTDVDVIIFTLGWNENRRGPTIIEDGARAVVNALRELNEEQKQKQKQEQPPRLIFLSSMTWNETLHGNTPSLHTRMIRLAFYYPYQDLLAGQRILLSEPSLLKVTLIQPPALIEEPASGYDISIDKAGAGCSYPDLGGSMVEVALDEAYESVPAVMVTSKAGHDFGRLDRNGKRMTKHTAAGIPTWSPTVVLICRSTAYVWQSGRDAQFSADCG